MAGRTDEFDAMLQRSSGWNLGIAFARRRPPGHRRRPRAVAGASTRSPAPTRFLANVDRTARNPNLLVASGRLWAIDYDACLYLSRALAGRAAVARAARRAPACRPRARRPQHRRCSTCGFGDGDGVPWADAATSSADGLLRFSLAGEAGPVTGELFELNGTWTATSSLDHDTTSGGVVGGSATLSTPELTLLDFDGVPGFSGAVRVPSFVATATAQAGHTAASPAASRDTITVQLWDDTAVPSGYRDVSISPTTSVDEIASATVVLSADVVTMTSRVLSQPAATSTSGVGLRTAATGQHSPMLLVTVDVVIVGPNASSFTITFDYGSVTARTGWLEAP